MRGAHDDDTIIDYAVKGLNHPDLTSKENKTILIMSIPSFRRMDEWKLMRDYISQYLDTNPNPEKFILRSLVREGNRETEIGRSQSANPVNRISERLT